jgi:RNA-binding motif X-linked protein 2
VYIGGFPFELSEGDLVIVFSQYGEIVDCRIVRDKETGKSKGFGFICYEDQRSTILAVDNLNGANISGRIIRVDHVEQYKIPKEYFQLDELELEENGERKFYKPSGPDGKGWGEDRILTPQEIKKFEEIRNIQVEKEMRNIQGDTSSRKDLMSLDADEQWEREFKNIVDITKQEELKEKQLKSEKKKRKKDKKEKKQIKLKKKEGKEKLKKEKEMKEIYKSYGLKIENS